MKETQEREAMLQQQAPFYQSHPQEDEIDLGDLFRVLVKRKLTIIGLTVLTTLIAIAYALIIPSVYESKSILLPPTEKQVEFFGVQGGITVDEAFNIFKRYLYSDRRQVFDSMKLIDVSLGKGSENVNETQVFADINGSFKLEEDKKGSDFMIPTMTLSFQGSDPGLNAEIINRLVKIASKNAKNELFENISEKINTQKVRLIEDINQLRGTYLANNLDEINRLQVENEFEQESIRNRIAVLRNRAINERKDRMEILSENARIAHDSGIILGTGTGAGAKLVEVNIERQSPLYLRGEKVLLSEIEQLKNRKSDDAFIPELRELDAKLLLLKSYLETKIKDLTVQGKTDAFIDGLRAKEVKLQQLHNLDFTRFQFGSVMNVNQVAYASEMRIKPKRKLIVVLGAVLGLMLGIFGAFFLNFLENQKQYEE